MTTPLAAWIRRELDAREWTQANFAWVLDRPAQFVSEVLTGKKELTRESARQIAAALDTSAEWLLRLQDDHALDALRTDPDHAVSLSAIKRRAVMNTKPPDS